MDRRRVSLLISFCFSMFTAGNTLYLVVHVAASGLSTSSDVGARVCRDTLFKWDTCRLVKLTWGLFHNETREEVRRGQRLIQPVGFEISSDATAIHAVTMEQAQREGVAVRVALDELMAVLVEADVVVFHNEVFTSNIIVSELLRAHGDDTVLAAWYAKPKACTMRLASTDPAAITHLSTLYRRMFGVLPGPWGRGHKDVTACAKCYGLLRPPPVAKGFTWPPMELPSSSTPLSSTPSSTKKRAREDAECGCLPYNMRQDCHGSDLTCKEANCDWCTCDSNIK